MEFCSSAIEGRLDHLLDLPATVETGPERPILHDRVDEGAITNRMPGMCIAGVAGSTPPTAQWE
jgi:hypothetical protein